MTDTYTVITDEQKLKEFIDWLPELQPNEKFYLALLARKKYTDKSIKFTKSDRTQLRRFLSNKRDLFDKINQLELPLNKWIIKGEIAPPESLALYIMPNPRCMKKATIKTAKKCLDFIASDPSGQYNIAEESISCVQKSRSRCCYKTFDIDTKEINIVDLMSSIKPSISYSLLETRGGYHVIIDPQNAANFNKHWYQQVTTALKEYLDVNNVPTSGCNSDENEDQMMPVAGCFQGGFTPILTHHENQEKFII